jgi:hypothetical protein
MALPDSAAVRDNSCMDINATVIVEELDRQGNVWRWHASHMVRTNVDRCIGAIRAGYNMELTRITVDGEVVVEPGRHPQLHAA